LWTGICVSMPRVRDQNYPTEMREIFHDDLEVTDERAEKKHCVT
jgi:hypothetical protein